MTEETEKFTLSQPEDRNEEETEVANKKMNDLALSDPEEGTENSNSNNDDDDDDDDDESSGSSESDSDNDSDKKKKKKKREAVLCVECEFSPAILTCPQCGNDPLCKLCFVTLHRKGWRHQHTPEPLPGMEDQFVAAFDHSSSNSSAATATNGLSATQQKEAILKAEGLGEGDDSDSSDSDSDDSSRGGWGGWSSWWSTSFREQKAKREQKRAKQEARRREREAKCGAREQLVDVSSKDSVYERAAYIPLRLSEAERQHLKLLIAALEACDYTDVVDAPRFGKLAGGSGNGAAGRARALRVREQVRGICAVLLGLTLAVDPQAGRDLEESKDFARHAKFYKSVFEIGRRHKIRNPDFMRTVYTKLMYIVQDSLLPDVQDALGFNLAAPLVTVRSYLEEHNAVAVLRDNLIEIATMEILSEGKSRQQVARDIKTKERAVEVIASRYKSAAISEDQIRTCLYSISDNNNFLRFNRDPIDNVITWLKEMFPQKQALKKKEKEEEVEVGGSNSSSSSNSSTVTETSTATITTTTTNDNTNSNSDKKTGKTHKLVFVEKKIEGNEEEEEEEKKKEEKKKEEKEDINKDDDDELSLAIDGGKDGSRLTHSHERQYLYVMQSLTLWREIQHDMYKLWVLAEQDLLRTESPYALRNTGQGLQRVQQAPQIYRAMQAILQATQARVGSWVGSSIIHIGDEQVPNALFFIDKYTQVPKILAPIVLTVKHVMNMPEDAVWKIARKYVKDTYGSPEAAKRAIMLDFFKRAFDGSGADNFFDAGSCIDGRLTSAWQWCTSLNTKPFFHLFLFSGFIGFDGLWK